MTGIRIKDHGPLVTTDPITTHAPDKWAFVDLETGDVWRWDATAKSWRSATREQTLALKVVADHRALNMADAATPLDDAGRRAFEGLRHYAPELVKTLRAAFDVGCAAEELKATAKKTPITRDAMGGSDPVYLANINKAVPLAIDYMAANPDAGVVVYNENGGWNWKAEGGHDDSG